MDELSREVARLRRTVLKHGHAQELFQGRVEDAMAGLTRGVEAPVTRLDAVQLRVLIELGQAARNMRDLAAGAEPVPDVDGASPLSVREGLDLLEIRVSNLQRSFGLEPIAATGKPFDDRLHQVHGVCHRGDLADGTVVEEVLPGYLLRGEVERPALVIVNRHRGEAKHEDVQLDKRGHRDG